MAAYLVVIRDTPIHTPEEIDIYHDKGLGSEKGHSIKVLAVEGALQILEGKGPEAVTILEFPTAEEARAWYDSPIYSNAVPHRLKAADYRTFIVDGWEPPAAAN